jgi:tetratricopeptide (TPR) repeat protein
VPFTSLEAPLRTLAGGLPSRERGGIRLVMSLARILGVASTASVTAILLSATPGHPPAKTETWTEIKSPHFVVYTDGSPKEGRRTADQFEQVRAVFMKLMGKARADAAEPIVILAVKDETGLRALLPQFYEEKGRIHPAGIFQPGEERNYVALRLDAPSESATEVLYHEYTHFLVQLNYGTLPIWLNEGLAEFYGHTRIGEKEVIVGQASPTQLLLLRDSKLLPLDSVFGAGHDSPLYNEANKATVFYAECWVIVHYLMLSNHASHAGEVPEYLRLVLAEGVNPVEAAHRAFGDPAALTKAIEDYAHGQTFFQWKMPPPARAEESSYTSRPVPEAESLAVRGSFLAYSLRPAEARPLLARAEELDPRLASPHEGLGLLELDAGNYDAAMKQFEEAADLDSHSAIAYFFSAQAVLRRSGSSADGLKEAERKLRRALELNPDLAPVHSQLASLLSAEGKDLNEALQHALRAAALQPGETRYLLNAGTILIQVHRFEDAKRIGTRVLAQAHDSGERDSAQSLMDAAQRAAEWQKEDSGEQQPVLASRNGPKAAPNRAWEPSAGEMMKLEGRVVQATCDAGILYLTLEAEKVTVRLHAADYTKVDYLTYMSDAPPNFSPCRDLKGHTIRATYRKFSGDAGRGELSTIELLE